MRRSGLLVVSLLMASACGVGEVAPPVETTTVLSTSTSPSTSTSATPTSTSSTTPPTTTTLPPTTTTTVAPWTTVPDPGMPPGVWGAGSGDPSEITSICLEWVLAGPNPPYVEGWADSLTTKLAILGVGVVSEGCDATLRLSLTGRRTSAVYGYHGLVCWSGEALEAKAALLIDGDVRRTWALADGAFPPPDSISPGSCADEDTGVWIEDFFEEDEVWHTVFFDMFGIGTDLATWLENPPGNGQARPESPVCWQGPPTEEDLRTLASLLSGRQSSLTLDWLSRCFPADQAEREVLLPLVPYLIAHTPGEEAIEVLRAITGMRFGLPDAWWAWWEGQG